LLREFSGLYGSGAEYRKKEVKQIECNKDDYNAYCLVSNTGGWNLSRINITILNKKEVTEN
jgi:hypothetical protein